MVADYAAAARRGDAPRAWRILVRHASCACRRLAFISLILSAGCAEPPNKEMNQAQGAIDAARAAGAERFATAEFAAATDALKRSEKAVAAGDYRQALSHAIDSRERRTQPRSPSKAAPTPRPVRTRDRRSRNAAVAAQAQLKNLASRPTAGRSAATVAAPKRWHRSARSAGAEDYAAVAKALDGAAVQLRAALAQIDAADGPAPSRRKR